MITNKGYWIPDAVTADILLVARTFQGVVGLFIERSNETETEPGKLAIPGGHMDETDEDIEDTAVRELREETGIVISKEQLQFIGPFSKKNRDPRGRYVSMAYYAWVDITDIKSGTAGDDAGAIALYDLKDVLNEELAFDHKDIVIALKKELGL